MFKSNNFVRISVVVLFLAGCLFSAKDAFAGDLEDGKKLLLDDKDIVAANAKFEAALAANSQEPENFWCAVTAVSENEALKTKLRELGIFDAENAPLFVDEAGEDNYNPVSAVDNIIKDNDTVNTAEYVETGDWTTVVSSTTNKTYGDDCRLLNSGAGSAAWTVAVPMTGYYRVYVWGGTFPANTTDAQYTIGANPPVAASSFSNHDKKWFILGTYDLSAGNVTVTLSGSASTGAIKVDGIKFEHLGEIKNDTEAVFGGTGTWETATYDTAFMGDCRWHGAGSGATATWTFTVPEAGKEYLVFTTWPHMGGMTDAADYTVTPSGGSSRTVTVNQEKGHGDWYCLGVFTFPNTSGNTVRLDSSDSGIVAADAVKIVPARPFPDMEETQTLLSGSDGTAGILTQIGEALVSLGNVFEDFTDVITPGQYPELETNLDLDYGDAMIFKTALYFLKFQIKMDACSDGDSADIRWLGFGSGEFDIMLSMLDDYPNFFKPRSDLTNEQLTALLGEARDTLLAGIDAYLEASAFIRARSDEDGLNHLLTFYPPKPQIIDYPDQQSYDKALAEWDDEKNAALNAESDIRDKLGEITDNLTDHDNHLFVTIPASFTGEDGEGVGIDIKIDLFDFFSAPKDVRGYVDKLLDNELVRDDFVDVDFGGVLPGFSPRDWNYLFGNGPELKEVRVKWNNDLPSAELEWDASKDPNKDNIDKYEIWRVPSFGATKDDGGTLAGMITDRLVTTFTDTGIDDSTNVYYYRLYTYYTGLPELGTAQTYSQAEKAVLAVYVDCENAGEGTGTRDDPYKDLGEAIDESSSGTKVRVSHGIYHEADSTLHMWGLDGLILEGGYDRSNGWTRNVAANVTTIDATGINWNGVTFHNVEGGTIDGFTITGAHRDNNACAVTIDRSSSIVIKNCKIINNDRGIGMWNNSSCSVENCSMTQNSYQAVSVDRSSLDISDSSIYDNAQSGNEWTGAIDVFKNSSVTAKRVQVYQNAGRGISVQTDSSFDISDSRIYQNGGRGIDVNIAFGRLFNNLITDNTNDGIYCRGYDLFGAVAMENNTVVNNGESGGIVCDKGFSFLEDDDQEQPGYFSFTGSWNRVWDSNANWGEYHLHEAGGVLDSATWTPNISVAGNYKVYATWTGDASHTDSAGYEIHYNGATATVYVNQTTGTSTWPGQELGQYNFAEGTGGFVVVYASATGQVVADSVKFEYVPAGPETFTPVIKNSIVANNNGGSGKRGICGYSGSNPAVSYNDVYGHTNGDYSGDYTNGGGNISLNAGFVAGPDGTYCLSQTAAGQGANSPCVDTGSDTTANLGLQDVTTRTDKISDTGIADMGYHYSYEHSEVIIDFGDQYGIWIRYNNTIWTHLHDLSPESMVTGDIDGNGKDDIIIDFGDPYGIWIRYNNTTWVKLHGLSPESIAIGDIDGNGKDDIIIDFGEPHGIWIRYNNSAWAKLHDISPESMVTGDIDGNGKDDLLIDFGDPYGIWIRYNNDTWTKLHDLSPESMVMGDIDGSGKDDCIIDFGDPYGIWIRYNDSSWTMLHHISPESMVTGDLDDNGKDDLIIDFGDPHGIWIRYNDSTWTKLHHISPESMVVGDLDGNGKDDLIIDFGDPHGIWIRYNDTIWAKLHDFSPESMVTGEMDND